MFREFDFDGLTCSTSDLKQAMHCSEFQICGCLEFLGCCGVVRRRMQREKRYITKAGKVLDWQNRPQSYLPTAQIFQMAVATGPDEFYQCQVFWYHQRKQAVMTHSSMLCNISSDLYVWLVLCLSSTSKSFLANLWSAVSLTVKTRLSIFFTYLNVDKVHQAISSNIHNPSALHSPKCSLLMEVKFSKNYE